MILARATVIRFIPLMKFAALIIGEALHCRCTLVQSIAHFLIARRDAAKYFGIYHINSARINSIITMNQRWALIAHALMLFFFLF